MTLLPGNVPHFSTYLVDFDGLERMYVRRPAGGRLPGTWDKLEELERRLHAFDWASMVIREPRQCTTFISDLAAAFVIGFEATVQVLDHERGVKPLDGWLKTLPDYDLSCRGLRTMRNLEAHIRVGRLTVGPSNGGIYTRFMNSMVSQPAVAWRFPQISDAEYKALKQHGRKLDPVELPAWNTHVQSEFAVNIMRSALVSLVAIVGKA